MTSVNDTFYLRSPLRTGLPYQRTCRMRPIARLRQTEVLAQCALHQVIQDRIVEGGPPCRWIDLMRNGYQRDNL